MDPQYMESIWWAFKSIWDKGLVYQGFKVMPYCPRCATPLSNFETAQGYEDVQDPAITVRFRASTATETALGAVGPLYFLAWTTTPWTLPSNLALAVGADIPYVRVRDGGNEYVLARDRVPAVWKDPGSVEILATFPGRELAGATYEPLFPYFAALGTHGAFRVLVGDFVSSAEGTGIVHMAPGFGEDDYALGQQHGLPVVCPVDADGRFTAEVPDYAGVFVKDADADIMRRLRDEQRLVHRGTLQHSYPHCYRCDAPLIYRAITTWFVRIDPIKERMLAEFPSGYMVTVTCSTVNAKSPGFAIYGHKATMNIGSSGERIELVPEKEFADEIDPETMQGLQPEDVRVHEKNWFDCIRNGAVPNANIDLAIRVQTVISLAEMADRLKMTCLFDETTRKITDAAGKEVAPITYGTLPLS